MPALTEQTQMLRVAQALEVFKRIAAGLTQEQACTEVGISVAMYRHWIATADEAIEAARKLAAALQRQQLFDALSAQQQGLDLMIADLLSAELEARDRLAIMKYLDDRIDQLERKFGTQSQTEDAALNYLKGPQLKRGDSRVGHRAAATINVSTRADGSVDITTFRDPDVIEGESKDPGQG